MSEQPRDQQRPQNRLDLGGTAPEDRAPESLVYEDGEVPEDSRVVIGDHRPDDEPEPQP